MPPEKTCSKCGITYYSNYCPNCGSLEQKDAVPKHKNEGVRPKTCPDCRGILSESDKYCGSCGAQVLNLLNE